MLSASSSFVNMPVAVRGVCFDVTDGLGSTNAGSSTGGDVVGEVNAPAGNSVPDAFAAGGRGPGSRGVAPNMFLKEALRDGHYQIVVSRRQFENSPFLLSSRAAMIEQWFGGLPYAAAMRPRDIVTFVKRAGKENALKATLTIVQEKNCWRTDTYIYIGTTSNIKLFRGERAVAQASVTINLGPKRSFLDILTGVDSIPPMGQAPRHIGIDEVKDFRPMASRPAPAFEGETDYDRAAALIASALGMRRPFYDRERTMLWF